MTCIDWVTRAMYLSGIISCLCAICVRNLRNTPAFNPLIQSVWYDDSIKESGESYLFTPNLLSLAAAKEYIADTTMVLSSPQGHNTTKYGHCTMRVWHSCVPVCTSVMDTPTH